MKKRIIIHIIFIIVLIVLANISLYYFIYFDDVRRDTTFSSTLFLNEKDSINYNIKTVDNDYLVYSNVNGYNPKNLSTIDVFYNYSITFDKEVAGDYSYYICGYLFDSTNNKKIIYKSDETKNNIDNKNVISINEITNIDIKKIMESDDVKSLENPNIKYEMVVYYHVYNSVLDKYISNSKTLEINIPMDDKNDNKIIKTPNEERGYKEYSNNIVDNDKKYLVISLEFLGSVILYVLCIAYLIEDISPKNYVIDGELKRIVKDYKEYLVGIDFIPDLSNKEVKFVEIIDELISYSKLYRVPVDYFEVVKHKEVVFAVITDKKAFVYKISVKRKK